MWGIKWMHWSQQITENQETLQSSQSTKGFHLKFFCKYLPPNLILTEFLHPDSPLQFRIRELFFVQFSGLWERIKKSFRPNAARNSSGGTFGAVFNIPQKREFSERSARNYPNSTLLNCWLKRTNKKATHKTSPIDYIFSAVLLLFHFFP